MFEVVVTLALLPLALGTVIFAVMLVLFIIVWASRNALGLLGFAVAIGLTIAALILRHDPVLAAEIYDYLFR